LAFVKERGRPMEDYIQVGQTALRSPSGDFLPAAPLYIKAEDAGQKSEITGRTLEEELLLNDIVKVFADKFGQYAKEVKRGTT
jgi:hypothetical protein